MTISVLGAGAFGTALAVTLSANASVTLWSRSAHHATGMQRTRENESGLAGVSLPKSIHVTADIRDIADSDIALLAVPMQQLRSVLQAFGSELSGKPLVACCKGIELGTHDGSIRIIETEVPGATAAILTGPSFAQDIARGLPTALTLGCADPDAAKALQFALTTKALRLYTTNDTTGAELGGALKNVMAIACGAVMGAGLGESARAALMTRGFAEMVRLAQEMGADPRTLAGLSGLGDLALTCTSTQSRNYQAGFALGSGSAERPNSTVEGIATALAVADLARQNQLELPITETVAALVSGETTITDAISELLSRPLKEE